MGDINGAIHTTSDTLAQSGGTANARAEVLEGGGGLHGGAGQGDAGGGCERHDAARWRR